MKLTLDIDVAPVEEAIAATLKYFCPDPDSPDKAKIRAHLQFFIDALFKTADREIVAAAQGLTGEFSVENFHRLQRAVTKSRLEHNGI